MRSPSGRINTAEGKPLANMVRMLLVSEAWPYCPWFLGDTSLSASCSGDKEMRPFDTTCNNKLKYGQHHHHPPPWCVCVCVCVCVSELNQDSKP